MMDPIHASGFALAAVVASSAVLCGLGKFADWIEEEKADRRAKKVEAIKAELRQASMASVGALKTLRDMGPSYAQAAANMAQFSEHFRGVVQANEELQQDAMTVAAMTTLSPGIAAAFLRRAEAAGFSRRSMIQALKEGQDVAGLERIIADTEASGRLRRSVPEGATSIEIGTNLRYREDPLDLELALAPGAGYVVEGFCGDWLDVQSGRDGLAPGEVTLQDKLRALEGRRIRYRLELVEE